MDKRDPWSSQDPGHCDEAVRIESYSLGVIPDHLKTQEMCNQAARNNPAVFFLVPDRFKTQEIYINFVQVDPWHLYDVPDHLKTQKICDDAARHDSSPLQFVPDWFITQQQINAWYDDDYWYNDDEIIEWYNGYQKWKAKKASIKEELMPIAWHADRVMDWCMSEDEKRSWK